MSSGSTRGRGGGVRGDVSSNCAGADEPGAEPVRNLTKAQKVTKRVGVRPDCVSSTHTRGAADLHSALLTDRSLGRQIFQNFRARAARAGKFSIKFSKT